MSMKKRPAFPPAAPRPTRCAWVLAAGLVLGACATPQAVLPDASAPLALTGLIARTSPAVVAVGDGRGAMGSGFRIEGSRFIVTAAHTLASLAGPPQVLWNRSAWKARLVRTDAANDLALVELEADAPMPGLGLDLRLEAQAPGEWVLVLGCPFGALPTATLGIVSARPGAVLEPAALQSRLQLNAAINPGNSGGPVVNLQGRVIGVANATVPGGYGLGFAVPAQAVANLLREALAATGR